MRTLLALLLLIPSLSWGKDLSGTKLFCKSKAPCYQESKGLCGSDTFFEFRRNNKVYAWDVSGFGLSKDTYNYEVKPSQILINYTFLQQQVTKRNGKNVAKINRATLSGCKIINHSNMEKLVNDYYRDNYLSRNKL